jgi:hypothetical protein
MRLTLSVLAVLCVLLVASDSQAQSAYTRAEINRINSVSNPQSVANGLSVDRIRAAAIGSAIPRGVAPGLLNGALGRPNKPFSTISRGPSVTPYLALDQPFANSATNYYTLVRPQLEQQRINQQMQRQTELMQRQLSQVTSRPPYDPQGSEMMAPTGHGAVYMNYGSYYTMPRPRQK